MPRKLLSKKQFKVFIERDEDGFFVASVPALPGCHTQAKTLPKLIDRVKEAIELCIEVANGDPEYQHKIERFAYDPTFVGVEVVTI